VAAADLRARRGDLAARRDRVCGRVLICDYLRSGDRALCASVEFGDLISAQKRLVLVICNAFSQCSERLTCCRARCGHATLLSRFAS